MNNPQELSLSESATILRRFIQHPNVRCFNFDEIVMAQRALAALDKAANPATSPE